MPRDDALLSMNFKFLISIFAMLCKVIFEKSISKRVPQPAGCEDVLSVK